MAEPNALQSMFSELNKAIHVSDYKQALKIANKIIHSKEGNKDDKAMHCKVVCLIYLNQFEEALKFIQSTPEIDGILIFEKAYCQYRLRQTDKALDTINDAEKLDIRLMELKAQILYKLGFYEDALGLYKKLVKECADDYEDERKANLLATSASISLWQQEASEVDLALNSYEQMYNKACELIGAGKAAESEKMLNDAIKECREYFEEDPDMEEEEIEAEMSVLRVQLAYTLQLQSREEEALKIYNQVLRARPSDVGLIAIASNNIITINKEQNVFDSKKKLKATLVPEIQEKLVSRQLGLIEMNKALLYMHSNQWEACRKLLKSLQRFDKNSDIPCLIQASQLYREKNYEKGISFLEDFIENHSDPDVHSIDLTHIKLTLVQMLFSQGHIDRACDVLQSIESIRHTPAIVSLLIALCEQKKGKDAKAIKILNDAVSWHKSKKSTDDIRRRLMWENAQCKIKHGKPEQAAEMLEKIRQLDRNNVKVLAQLIFAYSQFNPSKAHQLSEDLPSLEEMSLSVDVESLEKNATQLLAPRYVKRQAKQQAKLLESKAKEKDMASGEKAPVKKYAVSEAKTDKVIKTDKKKKKKKRLPKDFDPAVTPDAERWTPLRERSYYKGRRRDRKKGVGTGTQGTTAGSTAADSLDMSKQSSSAGNATAATPNSPKPAPTAQVNSPKPPSGARPKAKNTRNRKKKGKGGGW